MGAILLHLTVPSHSHSFMCGIGSIFTPILCKTLKLLCRLHNQISSSSHSSVVQGHIEFLGAPWRATVSEGLQVLSSNCYRKGLLLRRVLREWQVLVRLKSSSCQRRAAALQGQPRIHWKSVGTETSGSSREGTRLQGSWCIELAKGQRNAWMGLYTSPMCAFLGERTMEKRTRKVPRLP